MLTPPALEPDVALESGSLLEDSLLTALTNLRQLTPGAVRHLLEIKEQFMIGECLALAEWRERGDRTTAMFAEIKRLELKVLELADALGILQGRLGFLPAAQRVRFRPEGRYQVVIHARTFGLSLHDAAKRFLVDENTIARWIREATKNPDATTVGSLLKAVPPVRTISDVVRETVAHLDRLKVGGSRKIAEFLARSGIRIGRETVRRIRKCPPALPAQPEGETTPGSSSENGKPGVPTKTSGSDADPTATPLTPAPVSKTIRAKHPNHVWMTDITSVPTLFGLWSLKVVAFIDVFSRFPLAFRVFWKEPTAEQVCQVFEEAVTRFGVPKHFITDQGAQFTAGAFRDALKAHGVKHRFGAIGKTGSIAIIERLWRTMKEGLGLRTACQPLGQTHLTEILERFFFHYATIRPHQHFDGATPAERYFGIEQAAARAKPAPRKRTRAPDPPEDRPVRVVFLDEARRLPVILVNRASDRAAA